MIAVEHLVHGARRLGAAGLADDLRRHAGDSDVVRHRLEHHRAGGDARAMADLDIAEDLGAGADQHAAADLRMAVPVLLAGAAERHAVQDRDVVLDHRGLADHEAGGVVEEDAAADPRGRMDVALEHRRRAALQIEREILAALAPEPVRQPMRLDGVEALVIEHRLDEAVGGRIAVDRRDDVGAERLADRRLVLQRVGIGLPDQFGRDVGMVEPLADAVHDRRLERVVVQDGRVDEGRELGLAAHDLLGLAADARPDRIDLVERPRGPRLILSHGSSTPDVSRSPHRAFIDIFTAAKRYRTGALRMAQARCVKEIDTRPP